VVDDSGIDHLLLNRRSGLQDPALGSDCPARSALRSAE
jgi:hypothetical protein